MANKKSAALDIETTKWVAWVNTFVAKNAQLQSQVLRRTAFEALVRITKRTKVDTGRARAGWLVSSGTFNVPVSIQGKNVTQEAIEHGRAEGGVKQDVAGDVKQVVISNGVPYIVHLEYSADGAMVRPTLRELHESKLFTGPIKAAIIVAAGRSF